jgi:hypothetical protein
VALLLPVAIAHNATATGVWPDEVDPKDVLAYITSQPSATIHRPPESEQHVVLHHAVRPNGPDV